MNDNRGRGPFHKCYGSMTVGGHGQVVIPAEARKELGLNVGDKLLVFAAIRGEGLLLIKAEQLGQLVNTMTEQLRNLEHQLGEYLKAAKEGGA